MDKSKKALALFSGGLDSLLSIAVMQNQDIEVIPVTFETPYMPAARAIRTAKDNGLDLKVVNITEKHLEMLMAPVYGYGRNFNPCIDCHALMLRKAGELLSEIGADYLITGEVLGQRPMSQTRNSLQAVASHSGMADLILRPLSQKLLPDTKPILEGWVDKATMLDINGRGRYRQIELADKFDLTYPTPGGGCLLTDRNFSLRLNDLREHGQTDAANISLLRWGRHFRLDNDVKCIVGRTQEDNLGLSEENYPGVYFKIRDYEGPLGLLTSLDPSEDAVRLAASIVLAYSSKAASPDYVIYGIGKEQWSEILVEKCPESLYRTMMISLDKEKRC
jgi:tRNA-uridine 2-sulfurtransferase